jgi:hypothetical protein
LSPLGEFWNRLERALDLSKNVSEPAKNDFRLGNSPSSYAEQGDEEDQKLRRLES